jgi:hypothetical protein
MPEHGVAGSQLIQRGGKPFRGQEEHHPESGNGDVARQRGEHGHGWQIRHQREQRVAPVEAMRAAGYGHDPPVPGRCLHVVRDSAGDNPDAIAGGMHPPAEVDVVPEQHHAGVEAADLIPHIAADKHPRAADRQRVAVAVVLPLVGLTRLNAGDATAGRVDGNPGLKNDVAVGPVHHLGAEDGGGPDLRGAPEQLLERVRGRLAVVVQQPYPFHPLAVRHAGRPGHRRARRPVLQRARHRCGVAGTAVHPEDDRLAELARQHGAAPVPAARVDGDDPLHRPGLAKQRAEDMRQPGGAVVRDDDRGDDVLGIRVVRRQGRPVAPQRARQRGRRTLAGAVLAGRATRSTIREPAIR